MASMAQGSSDGAKGLGPSSPHTPVLPSSSSTISLTPRSKSHTIVETNSAKSASPSTSTIPTGQSNGLTASSAPSLVHSSSAERVAVPSAPSSKSFTSIDSSVTATTSSTTSTRSEAATSTDSPLEAFMLPARYGKQQRSTTPKNFVRSITSANFNRNGFNRPRVETGPASVLRPAASGERLSPRHNRENTSPTNQQAQYRTALDSLLANIDSAPQTRERSQSDPFWNSWSYRSASHIVPITHPSLKRNIASRNLPLRKVSQMFAPLQNSNKSPVPSATSESESKARKKKKSKSSERKKEKEEGKSSSKSSKKRSSEGRTLVSSSSRESLEVPGSSTSTSSQYAGITSIPYATQVGSTASSSSSERSSSSSSSKPHREKTGVSRSKTGSSKSDGKRKSSEKAQRRKSGDIVMSTHSSPSITLSSSNSGNGALGKASTYSSPTSDYGAGAGSAISPVMSPVGSPYSNGSTASILSQSSVPEIQMLSDSDDSDRESSTSPADSPPLADSSSSALASSSSSSKGKTTGSATGMHKSSRSSKALNHSAPDRRSRAPSGDAVYWTDSEPAKQAKRTKHPGSALDDVIMHRAVKKTTRRAVEVLPLNLPAAGVGLMSQYSSSSLGHSSARKIPNAMWLSNVVSDADARMFFNYLQSHFKDSQLCEAVIMMHTEIVSSRFLLDNLLSLYESCTRSRSTQTASSASSSSLTGGSVLATSPVSYTELGSTSPGSISPNSTGTSPPPSHTSYISTIASVSPLSSPVNSPPHSPTPLSGSVSPHHGYGSSLSSEPDILSESRRPSSQALFSSSSYSSLHTPATPTHISSGSSSSRLTASNSTGAILQTSIINFLKKWVRLNTQDFIDDSILQDMVRDFVRELRRRPGIECQMGVLVWDLLEASLLKLDDDPNALPLANSDVLMIMGKLPDEGHSKESPRSARSSIKPTKTPSPRSMLASFSYGVSSGSPAPTPPLTPSSAPTMSAPSTPTSPHQHHHPNSPVSIPEHLLKFTEYPAPFLGREAIATMIESQNHVHQMQPFSYIHSPVPSTPTVSLAVLDLSPLELARQWCLLDHTAFSKVRFRDFLRFASHPEDSPSLNNLSNGFNHTTCWVATQILRIENPKKRARMVVHMISLAEELLQLNNYHAFFGVIIGLTQLSIGRLRETWKKVGKKELKTLKHLQGLASPLSNFAALRNLHDSTPPPFVPLPALFLRDLVMLTELSHKGFINPQNCSVNVEKIMIVEKLLGRLHAAQRNHFNFVPIKSIQHVILSGTAVPSEELEAWSARIEPGRDL